MGTEGLGARGPPGDLKLSVEGADPLSPARVVKGGAESEGPGPRWGGVWGRPERSVVKCPRNGA